MNPSLIPLVVFLVTLLVLIPALYHYARRPGVHPRFRPKLGELALVTILGLGLCAGITTGLSLMLGLSDDLQNIKSGDSFRTGESNFRQTEIDKKKDKAIEEKKARKEKEE